ncbi:hypothetical protein BV98_001478 [Sphingobium herbicidovorans NBRC 16415]|uniref:Uncharacterized protein n=1 Tax=Sphingobium herbicidovorans (strain ATCC 700291 / DSM 11019 / CCUG 56400 / KCTC 2939 / LMG 18315 / NBRC 16415 / MH) TaxID=1219045 RepID=A0A086PBJ8_SPHHM|nr:hypothetical protein BV98_001478 [Sphingobium herbicidovorans NBRC 16415]
MKCEDGHSEFRKFTVKFHGSFAAILGFVALMAEFSKPFDQAKQYALTHDGALPICYGCWLILYGLKYAVSWKLRSDLAQVREENRRKRGKR